MRRRHERTQRVLLEDDLGSEWLHRDAAMSLQLDDAMHIALFKIV